MKRDYTTAFEKHQAGAAHREAVELFVLLSSQTQGVDRWLSKKSNKYTAHEIQDTILKEMAHKVLHDIGQNIRDDWLLSTMADECTDCSNKEQFTINIL